MHALTQGLATDVHEMMKPSSTLTIRVTDLTCLRMLLSLQHLGSFRIRRLLCFAP